MSRLTGRGFTTSEANAFEARCVEPHVTQWRANCYKGSDLIAEDVPVVGGTLTLDSSDPVRRKLTIEIGGGERWAPVSSNSPLVPFGQRITLWCRIDLPDGSWSPWLKQGEYHIVTHSFERPSLIATVDCVDLSGAVDEYKFLQQKSWIGHTVRNSVVQMVQEALPNKVFSVDASNSAETTTVSSFVADSGMGRWEASTTLAFTKGHECFFDSNGDLVIRHDVTDDNDESIPGNGPDIGTVTNPIATLRDGNNGNIIGMTATTTREGGCNGVRINLHSSVPKKKRRKKNRDKKPEWRDAPINAHITELQVGGPVDWGDTFGRIPIVIDRDVKDLKKWGQGGAETWNEMQAAYTARARHLLHRRRGVVRYIDLDCVPLYWLEPDDKVNLKWRVGEDNDVRVESHYAQMVEFDLAGGPMRVRTRSLNVTDPGT